MRAAIAWMAKNIVAANLVMLLLMVGGLLYGSGVKQEIFPEIELDVVNVSVVYPGAAPQEVESGICLPIEEAIFAVDGIKEIKCVANEGAGVVTAEALLNTDVDLLLQDIKSEVDRIQTFPDDAEDPQVSKTVLRKSVISVAVFGDLSEKQLREQAELIRDDILDDPRITQVELGGARPYEIAIEVSEANLQKYRLTLDQIAERIRQASVDVPGGLVKTQGEQILLRTNERKYTGEDYSQTSILTLEDGTDLRLSDIDDIKDAFDESDISGSYNGKPAVMVKVYRVGDQRPIETSDIVKEYIQDKRQSLAPGVSLEIWSDRSELLRSRMTLLLKNAYVGLILVLVILGLFLEVRLAFWVTMGIPISFLGALFVLPAFDVTINMVSLFAFILSLGIVVDDAIIVGENIYEHRTKGKSRLQAAIDGTMEVASAVTFSILTSVAAFLPMLFVSGQMGKFMRVIPIIVIATLVLSLFECMFILPAHLAHSKVKKKRGRLLQKLEDRRLKVEDGLSRLINGPYLNSLKLAVTNRYVTAAIGIAILLVCAGMMTGGYLKMVHMPKVDAQVVQATLQMPLGTPTEETELVRDYIFEKAEAAVAHFSEDSSRQDVVKSMYSVIGTTIQGEGHVVASRARGSHHASIAVFLVPADERTFSSHDFVKVWREQVGEIPGVNSLEYLSTMIRMGSAIDLQLEHEEFSVLREVADTVKNSLSTLKGVGDVRDNLLEGKRELRMSLRNDAKSLGITELDLGRQVRAAFYGSEALRLQRGRDEVKVIVRYPEDERLSLGDVESMRVRSRDGAEIQFDAVADIEEGTGYSAIRRSKRKRVVNVRASVEETEANAKEIVASLEKTLMRDLLEQYPGLSYQLEGQEKERNDSMNSLYRGFAFVMLLIYALLAIPFKSYVQPAIVMMAIPFGFVGAVIGHMLLGYDISVLSMCGLVALSGVVVNDSLILVDYVNRARRGGMPVYEAVLQGGCRRFRPIILTSLTTFFGLTPIIFETSLQAQFLIPMAISLGFGVLFATVITLYLIPVFYVIIEDVVALVTGQRRDLAELV